MAEIKNKVQDLEERIQFQRDNVKGVVKNVRKKNYSKKIENISNPFDEYADMQVG